MFLDKKTSIKSETILILAYAQWFSRNRARMYSRVRSMASSRNKTVKPWNSIQIEEEDVQFLETLVDCF